MTADRRLSEAEALGRLSELLDLGGDPERLVVVHAPRGCDPKWVHLKRPDGGERRVAMSSIRALANRGWLREETEDPTAGRVFVLVPEHLPHQHQ